MSKVELIAATAFGLEAVASRELTQLGYQPRIISTGRVLFEADLDAVPRANIWLRTADRVLLRLHHFHCPDFDALFDTVQAMAWERWIGPDFEFPVNGRSVKSQLSSVPAVQRTVKKAVVERLLKAHRTQTLPETGPRVMIEAALLDNECTITIDTSGIGLHKRGYRDYVGEAAMKETLAAGLVLLSVWNPERPLIDPFCGSGTIPIEAAMIGLNLAPGRERDFDSAHWPAIPESAWDRADEEAHDLARAKLPVTIHASDVSEEALALARRHAAAAGVERSVHFSQRAFGDLASKADYGCTIMNPPYGVRLGETAPVEELYRTMPRVLRGLPTWSHHILTAYPDFERLLGQQATRRRKLFNAQIECTYYSFLGPRPPEGAPNPAVNEETESAPDALAIDQPSPPAVEAVKPAFGGLRERDIRELDDFESRLAKRARHLRKWPDRGIHCYRLYERDCPDVPLTIDRYEDHAHIFEYERGHSRTPAQHADWCDAVVERTARVLGIPASQVHMKDRPRQRGLTQHERVGDEHVTLTAREGGLRFEVNLTDYTDTGLFLDHRITRSMVRDLAAGRRFLNLFCYTGSFTVYAVSGGATSSVSVDLSNTYLDWAQRNLALNAPASASHRMVRSDVLAFLREHAPGTHYDLAVIDPPTFSNSKRTETDFEVQSAHVELIVRTARLMSPGGTIFFSNNFRQFKLDQAGLESEGLQVREISRQTVPEDFRNERIHRCWRIGVPA
ncbi:MAG: bifunctional 23S rRNA (guanine(2069)-N(7))-methyltransferase RlmK/23S rRNA (guanine(2445)-N(2))-methyltransferase RlmL [Planctomycetes bacterium]|nr:bifunctional 23S rRNA (guanine(2069)-N(7))-methyltransferase RlmK/23S rRNA (guanine(2445)-N(2))-methyltransferase RlmL [Planctomycetota bacterium]